jgi:hypothetical protein
MQFCASHPPPLALQRSSSHCAPVCLFSQHAHDVRGEEPEKEPRQTKKRLLSFLPSSYARPMDATCFLFCSCSSSLSLSESRIERERERGKKLKPKPRSAISEFKVQTLDAWRFHFHVPLFCRCRSLPFFWTLSF